MFNRVELIGYVGQDPQIREFENGKVGNFSLATKEIYNDRNGQRQESTEWHNINAKNRTADIASRLSKGSLAHIEGVLKTREYTDKNNVNRKITEVLATRITFLSSNQNGGGNDNGNAQTSTPASKAESNVDGYTQNQGSQQPQQPQQPQQNDQVPVSEPQSWDDEEDDLPF